MKITIGDLIDLFDTNEKSLATVFDEYHNEVFSGRIDYLQFTRDGVKHRLCKKEIKMLDIQSDYILIYT